MIHIRIQHGKKIILTIQGLDDNLNLDKILKVLKRNLHCNGTIIEDETFGKIIQLQGDHRNDVRDFFIRMKICKSEEIIVHG